MRPAGISRCARSHSSSLWYSSRKRGVATRPVAIQLTVMPSAATSIESVFIAATTAARNVLESVNIGDGSLTVVDVNATMRPQFFRRIAGSA